MKRAAALARAFRRHQLPVVLVNVTGTPPGRTQAARRDFTPPPGWADLAGELSAHPGDHKITTPEILTMLDTHGSAPACGRGGLAASPIRS